MTQLPDRPTLVRTATGTTVGAVTRTADGTWQPLILTADGAGFQPIDTQDAPDLFEAAGIVNAEYAELVRMGDR